VLYDLRLKNGLSCARALGNLYGGVPGDAPKKRLAFSPLAMKSLHKKQENLTTKITKKHEGQKGS